MSSLDAFAITRKWPAQHPDRIQGYSLPTDGKPLALFESGAILIYLACKTGRFMPAAVAGRYETLQWLMFQMGGIGPMFGQLGFFHNHGASGGGQGVDDSGLRAALAGWRRAVWPGKPRAFASNQTDQKFLFVWLISLFLKSVT